jgi:maleate cis-trans isomerase
MLRIGMIFPSGGTEPEYYQAVERSGTNGRMYVVISRGGGDISGGDHSVDSLLQTARVDYLEDAARRLGQIGVDSVMWACTSGSFVIGVEAARNQRNAIAKAAGAPSSSTSLAFIEAIESLGVNRVAVVSPYPREATESFLAFLSQCDIDVVKSQRLNFRSGWDSAAFDQRNLIEVCKASDDKNAQAVVVPDTALSTLSILTQLEQTLGKPVLTANQVTIWKAFLLANSRPPACLGCLNMLESVERIERSH